MNMYKLRVRPFFVYSVFTLALVLAGTWASGCKRTQKPTSEKIAAQEPRPAETAEQRPETAEQRLGDEEITQAIERELLFDQAVNVTKIDVSTTNGIVELTGEVDNLLAKKRAMRIAETVKGARAVSNRIKVMPAKARTDEAIRQDVENAMLWNPATESYEIKAAVRDNEVTLTGTVQSWAEKKLAERVAMGVKGVTDIENNIDIEYKTRRADAELEKEIRQRMRWDVLVDQALIDVDVEDGKVTLSGVVGSAAERSRAYQDAWVAGVMSVEHDDLEVQWWAKDEDLRKSKYVVKSDKEIADAIKSAALFDPRLYSFNIKPEVTGGVVTLEGTVDNLKAKRAAEQLARHTVGVVSVDNKLEVEAKKPLADAQIAKRINASLLMNPITESYEIDVEVKDGEVTLTGTVDSYFEKAEAEAMAMNVRGVTEVANELSVVKTEVAFFYDPYVDPYEPYTYTLMYVPTAPAKGDQEIRDDINDELFWSPFVDADQVQVKVENGKATLTGTVDTWRERAAATENALEGGAITVDNKLEVK